MLFGSICVIQKGFENFKVVSFYKRRHKNINFPKSFHGFWKIFFEEFFFKNFGGKFWKIYNFNVSFIKGDYFKNSSK